MTDSIPPADAENDQTEETHNEPRPEPAGSDDPIDSAETMGEEAQEPSGDDAESMHRNNDIAAEAVEPLDERYIDDSLDEESEGDDDDFEGADLDEETIDEEEFAEMIEGEPGDDAVIGSGMVGDMPEEEFVADEAISDLVTPPAEEFAGKIFLVGVPIGNREDITLRAIRTLQRADVVVCEEYKTAARLLREHNISKKLIEMNEHNEAAAAEEVIGLLRDGKQIAVISDAGLPLLADPGSILVRRLRAIGAEPRVIPGISSVTTALMTSGFDIESFDFAGFLPRKPDERLRAARSLAERPRTTVILETPYRLRSLLSALAEAMPNRRAAIAINLTMSSEATIRGTLAELNEKFLRRRFRGEFVIVLDRTDGLKERRSAVRESAAMEEEPESGYDAAEFHESEIDFTPARDAGEEDAGIGDRPVRRPQRDGGHGRDRDSRDRFDREGRPGRDSRDRGGRGSYERPGGRDSRERFGGGESRGRFGGGGGGESRGRFGGGDSRGRSGGESHGRFGGGESRGGFGGGESRGGERGRFGGGESRGGFGGGERGRSGGGGESRGRFGGGGSRGGFGGGGSRGGFGGGESRGGERGRFGGGESRGGFGGGERGGERGRFGGGDSRGRSGGGESRGGERGGGERRFGGGGESRGGFGGGGSRGGFGGGESRGGFGGGERGRFGGGDSRGRSGGGSRDRFGGGGQRDRFKGGRGGGGGGGNRRGPGPGPRDRDSGYE